MRYNYCFSIRFKHPCKRLFNRHTKNNIKVEFTNCTDDYYSSCDLKYNHKIFNKTN